MQKSETSYANTVHFHCFDWYIIPHTTACKRTKFTTLHCWIIYTFNMAMARI